MGKEREEQAAPVTTSCAAAGPVRRGLQTIRNPKESAEPFKTAGVARQGTSRGLPFLALQELV